MFRKLISGVSFSPALVGQLSFYARRLRKEEATRRLGLIFTALALIVQSFVVFSPPEAANAASTSDFIYGGVSSVSQILAAYDNPKSDFKKIMTYVGVTRTELANLKQTSFNSREYGTGSGAWLTWGRESRFSAAQGEVKHVIDSQTTVYSKPLWLYDSTSWTKTHGSLYTNAFRGTSAKRGEIIIMGACGNLVSRTVPTPTPVAPAPSPVARCSNVEVLKTSDTTRSFKATSYTAYGATISKYTFAVTNGRGTVVSNKSYGSTVGSYTSPAITLSPGTYTIKVTVTTSLGNKTSDNCQQTFSVASPDISIEKTVNNTEKITADLNETFTYKIIVKNTGGTTLRQLAITDDAPDGINFTATSGGTIIGNKWSASIESLAPKASKTYTITAKAVKRFDVGKTLVKNTACVTTPSISDSNCDNALVEMPETTMSVCELSSDKIITIKKSQFDDELYSTNPLSCEKIQVCDTTTNTVITIRTPDYNDSTQTKSLSDCDDIQVCDLSTGNVTIIKQHEFTNDNYSNDASDCVPTIVQAKSALNMTQSSVDATEVVAQASDRIRYKLTATNIGRVNATADFTENLQDVLEYATVIDTGGGSFNESTKLLSWASVTLAPGETQTRLFTVELAKNIPAAARGTSDPTSYDCTMLNTYGNNVAIDVSCPASKTVEQAASELPHTGPTENMIIGGLLLSIVVYFYARSRQLGKEVRLIRRDINTGTI